jgi:hypothetical protein
LLHLVDDSLFCQNYSITLIYQDQRGSLLFLVVDQGRCFIMTEKITVIGSGTIFYQAVSRKEAQPEDRRRFLQVRQ